MPALPAMTVRVRLILTLLAIALVLILPALYGLGRLRELRDITFELTGRHAAASVALGSLQTAIADLDHFERSYIAAPAEASREAMWRALEAATTAHDRLVEAGYGPEAEPVQTELTALRTATTRIEELVEAGDVAGATDYFRQVRPRLVSAQSGLEPIARAIDTRSSVAASRAREISASAARTTLAVMLVSFTLAIAVGVWITGFLTIALSRLRRAMSRVAEGEFEAPGDLPYERSDELGDLSRSFRAMTEQLSELNRLKAEFVSIASHELKTPINVIGGYGEMIEEGVYGELNEQQTEALRAIRDQVKTLTRQVNQLLDISRFESGALQVQMDEVKLSDLFTGVQRAFEALARQKSVTFELEIDPSAPEAIGGDPDRLRNEVMGNLLANAFKFTPAGGAIAVSARGEGDRVLLTVRDTGEGIPSEDLPHIFEKYYQSGQRARAMGTGLGLAIAREIVEIHGGRIEASSVPGEGTTFVVNLPIHQRPERSKRAMVRLDPGVD